MRKNRYCSCPEWPKRCKCKEADEKFGITEMVNKVYERAETARTGFPAIDNPKDMAADVIAAFGELLEADDAHNTDS